jgi:rhodanese-related sulfurtransferase
MALTLDMTRIAAAAALALSLAACASPAGSEHPATSGSVVPGVAPGVVDVDAARKLVEAGIKVVDVRTPAEFAAGHLPGAVNVPYDEVQRRAAELGPPGSPLLLYCRSGRRSAIAADTLRKLGFDELYDLQAYSRWAAAQAGLAGR